MMIYSSTTSGPSSHLSNIKFSLQDTLSNNVGPISDFTVSESFDPCSQSLTSLSGIRYAELATCSNIGKHGSVSILQEGIRPKIVKGIDIKDCKGIFTAYKQGSVHTSWLFISKGNSTLVFSTGQGIHEIKIDGFAHHPSLLIENILNLKRVVRVCSREIILLNSGSLSFSKSFLFYQILNVFFFSKRKSSQNRFFQIRKTNQSSQYSRPLHSSPLF